MILANYRLPPLARKAEYATGCERLFTEGEAIIKVPPRAVIETVSDNIFKFKIFSHF